MLNLSGKVALVTGGSRGFGRATVRQLAAAGADIVINFAQDQAAAEQVAQEVLSLGRQVAIVKGDVREAEDVAAMLDFVGETFGRLDVLVCHATATESRPLLDLPLSDFDNAMHTNVRGPLLLVRAALPWLRNATGRGKVIGISDRAAQVAQPAQGLLGAAKAALESTMRQLALELAGESINFNVVQAGTDDSAAVANTVLFLASPLADGIQGQAIAVGGSGIQAHRANPVRVGAN